MRDGASPLLSFAVVVMGILLWASADADSYAVRADLAFQFACEDKDRLVLEDDIVGFLRDEHFKILNLGRIQREHNVFVLDVEILAIDDLRRIVDITSYPLIKNTYTLTLATPLQHGTHCSSRQI